MKAYRKRPISVAAEQFVGGAKSAQSIIDFAQIYHVKIRFINKENIMEIPTEEGTMTAQVGDWIIHGVRNEFYPCKPDIFELTYEPLENYE